MLVLVWCSPSAPTVRCDEIQTVVGDGGRQKGALVTSYARRADSKRFTVERRRLSLTVEQPVKNGLGSRAESTALDGGLPVGDERRRLLRDAHFGWLNCGDVCLAFRDTQKEQNSTASRGLSRAYG